jgi:hypothetical protein
MGLSRKQTQLRAYFAGIIDGEGCFIIHLGPDGDAQARVTVSMNDPEAILMLSRCYPKAVLACRRPKSGPSLAPYFQVSFGLSAGYVFIKDILPFLLVKHDQAKVWLSFAAHRRRDHYGHGKAPANCHGRCQRFADKIKALRSEAKGVKTVNALVDHDLREYRAKREEAEQDRNWILAQLRTLLDRVETRDRAAAPVEPMSAPEQELVHPTVQ